MLSRNVRLWKTIRSVLFYFFSMLITGTLPFNSSFTMLWLPTMSRSLLTIMDAAFCSTALIMHLIFNLSNLSTRSLAMSLPFSRICMAIMCGISRLSPTPHPYRINIFSVLSRSIYSWSEQQPDATIIHGECSCSFGSEISSDVIEEVCLVLNYLMFTVMHLCCRA